MSWITPPVDYKDCNFTFGFSVPQHISVFSNCMKSKQRNAGVGNMPLQPRLSETHWAASPIIQIWPRQHFKLVHLVSKWSHVPHYDGGKRWFKPLPQAFIASALQLMGDLKSPSGYNLASWYFNHLLPLVNNSLVAMVTYQVGKKKDKVTKKNPSSSRASKPQWKIVQKPMLSIQMTMFKNSKICKMLANINGPTATNCNHEVANLF